MHMICEAGASPVCCSCCEAQRRMAGGPHQQRGPEGRPRRLPGGRQLLTVPRVGGPVEAAEQCAPLLVGALRGVDGASHDRDSF